MKWTLLVSMVILYHLRAQICPPGLFIPADGTQVQDCKQCHPSCKECSEIDSCTSCEDFMFINSTTGLCQLCDEGSYYDFSSDTCRPCMSSCSGYCKHQPSCFECGPTEIFDLDSLACTTTCDSHKSLISDSTTYEIGTFCRNLEYYIDPNSAKVIEIGTREYPYRTMTPVFVEILNHLSHQEVEIIVNVKENTTIFIEDSKNYIMNVTQVTIQTYSENSSDSGVATLVITDGSIEHKSPRAAFHLIKDMSINLVSRIAAGNFSEFEANILGSPGDAFQVSRSSFKIQNFIVYRKASNIKTGIFIQLSYLQHRMFDMKNMEFYVSGTISKTLDPMSYRLENIRIDTTKLFVGFAYTINCNYPEAYLTPTSFIKNFTAVNLGEHSIVHRAYLMRDTGPGNFTGENIDIRDHYQLMIVGDRSIVYNTISLCLPIDDIPQTNSIKGYKSSLSNNSDSSKISILDFTRGPESHRVFHDYFEDISITDYYNSQMPAISAQGSGKDHLTLKNVHVENYNCLLVIIGARGHEKIYVENITYVSGINNPAFSLYFENNNHLEIDGMVFRNYTGSNVQNLPAVFLRNIAMTNMVVKGVEIYDSDLDNQLFIVFAVLYNHFSLTDVVFSNVTIAPGKDSILVAAAMDVEINNVSISQVVSSSLGDTTSSVININTIALATPVNSSIMNVEYTNSSVQFIKLSSFTPPLITTKLIELKNMKFSNCYYEGTSTLLSTNGLAYNLDIIIEFDNITFENIEFKSKGILINFGHQLPSNVSLTNSLFNNISSGSIDIGSNYETRVLIHNISIDQISHISSSFFNTRNSAKIYLREGRFIGMSSYLSGGVLSGFSRSIARISDSLFQNNYARNGGVFNAEDEANIVCKNCTITQNFALTSGVINVAQNGKFEFHDSEISMNYAHNSPISQLLDSVLISMISNTQIFLNEAVGKSEMNQEFNTSCSKLCFISDEFKVYSDDHFGSDIVYENEDSILQLTSASLSIVSGSRISQQSTLIHSFGSEIEFSDSFLSSFTLNKDSIGIISSNLKMKNMTIEGIQNPSNHNFILIFFDSTFTVNKLRFNNSQSILFNAQKSSLDITQIRYENVTGATNLFEIADCTNVTVTNIRINDSSVIRDQLFLVSKSNNVSFDNIEVKDQPKIAISIISTHVSFLLNSELLNCTEGLSIKSSKISRIENIIIRKTGSSEILHGGAIKMVNSDIAIINSTLEKNTARLGGAIYFSCTSMILCNLKINTTSFTSNQAVQGGAVYYDYARPEFGHEIIYTNNSADYGPNIGSYGVKITMADNPNTQMKLTDVGSGIKHETKLAFAIRDYDDQIMILNSVNQIIFSSVNNSRSTVKGFNSASLDKGISKFDNFIVEAGPGEENIRVRASSNAIDQNKIRNIFGDVISNNTVELDFRLCKPGEFITGNSCTVCSPGTYSLDWMSPYCSKCIDNTVCEGGSHINVNPGYWRRTANSTSIIECIFKDACEGGYYQNRTNPTQCKTGYTGSLCTKCDILGNNKYEPAGSFECLKCPNPIFNAIRVFGVALLVFLYFMVIIIVNIRKTTESGISILLRILTNYAQIITTTIGFSTKYPTSLSDLLTPVKTVGDSSESFMSFDCFITDYEVKGPFPSSQFFKLFLSFWLPLILFILISLIWLMMSLKGNKWKSNLSRNIIISFISIVFLLHPKLAQLGISIFRCIKIDENINRVRIDTDIICYSSEHFKWSFLLGFPILLVWVISMPILAILILRKTRNSENSTLRNHFLILYQGLKSKHYYWEFVNSLRKICILISFLLPSGINIMFACIILITTWRLQNHIQPYKLEENNKIEILGINIGIITLCSGLIYNQEDTSGGLDFIVFVIILWINIIFIFNWTYLLLVNLRQKYPSFAMFIICLKFILLKWEREDEFNIKNPEPIRKLIIGKKSTRTKIKKSKKKLSTSRRRGNHLINKRNFEEEKNNDNKITKKTIVPNSWGNLDNLKFSHEKESISHPEEKDFTGSLNSSDQANPSNKNQNQDCDTSIYSLSKILKYIKSIENMPSFNSLLPTQNPQSMLSMTKFPPTPSGLPQDLSYIEEEKVNEDSLYRNHSVTPHPNLTEMSPFSSSISKSSKQVFTIPNNRNLKEKENFEEEY